MGTSSLLERGRLVAVLRRVLGRSGDTMVSLGPGSSSWGRRPAPAKTKARVGLAVSARAARCVEDCTARACTANKNQHTLP